MGTLILVAWTAAARPDYRDDVPNGYADGCGLCHVGAGGTPRNPFGLDYESLQTWPLLFGLDSDGDGFTNGEELGDPEGAWSPGEEAPFPYASHPGEATSVPGAPDDSAPAEDTGSPPSPSPEPLASEVPEDEGCGCATRSGPAWPLAVVGALGVRRRRAHPPRGGQRTADPALQPRAEPRRAR